MIQQKILKNGGQYRFSSFVQMNAICTEQTTIKKVINQLNLKKHSLVITGKVPICITTCDVERSSVMTGKVLEGQQ